MKTTITALTLSTLIGFSATTQAAAPDIQAPSPEIDTQWALAAVEMPEPRQLSKAQPQTLISHSHQHNTWIFRSLVDGQMIETKVTELMQQTARLLAQTALDNARELAGL